MPWSDWDQIVDIKWRKLSTLLSNIDEYADLAQETGKAVTRAERFAAGFYQKASTW